ncbi:hypothetical protein [Pseudonocardia sp. HH130630-07]|nr:hypothetical protein [Pseudonocardia sp. HH130630-07]
MSRRRGRHRTTETHHSTLRMRPVTQRRRRLDGLRNLIAAARPGW